MRATFDARQHPLGHTFENSQVTAFFGDQRSTADRVSTAFPDFELAVLKQTHSNTVVAATADHQVAPPEADAHFTRARKMALVIRTADCLPVLIHEPDSGVIAAIHAGWRGVENEIIRRTCEHLNATGAVLSRARAWIGPHIRAASFEVGRDVAAQLEARFEAVRGFSNATSCILPHEDPTKARVDLSILARAQLAAHGIDSDRVTELAIDTVASPQHMSFRRDRERAGRQISFIALK